LKLGMDHATTSLNAKSIFRSIGAQNKMSWNEIKSDAIEFKRTLERDMLLRRYHKWSNGESTFEDRVASQIIKVKTIVITSWRAAVKRSLDSIISVVGLIVLSPVMMLVAIAIKMDSKGPVMLCQTRVGMKGRTFKMYKFRSMYQNAETKSGPVWAIDRDPRVTSVGKFLRDSHLDEIPQLFNVLKGEMSLVGPRPERPYFVSEFRIAIPHYDRRLCAKPGITGLAQIRRGYDETLSDVKKKIRYDVLYIKKMCPLLDLKLMTLTVGAVFFTNRKIIRPNRYIGHSITLKRS